MLIEIAKGYGVETVLVLPSSCSVYGATDEIMDESSTVEPVSLYGETKSIVRTGVCLKGATASFHPVIMRFCDGIWTFESSTV